MIKLGYRAIFLISVRVLSYVIRPQAELSCHSGRLCFCHRRHTHEDTLGGAQRMTSQGAYLSTQWLIWRVWWPHSRWPPPEWWCNKDHDKWPWRPQEEAVCCWTAQIRRNSFWTRQRPSQHTQMLGWRHRKLLKTQRCCCHLEQSRGTLQQSVQEKDKR